MSRSGDEVKPLHGELVPPERRRTYGLAEIPMPEQGGFVRTAFWLALRFRSQEKVLDSYRRAASAAAGAKRAEADLDDARIEHARARRRLESLDAILDADTERLHLELERNTEQLKLEVLRSRVAAVRELRGFSAELAEDDAGGRRRGRGEESEVAELRRELRRKIKTRLELREELDAYKAEIIKKAGGEEGLTAAQREAIEDAEELTSRFIMNLVGLQAEG